MAKAKFPKKLYLYVEGEDEDAYLATNESPGTCPDGPVAIYVLQSVHSKVTPDAVLTPPERVRLPKGGKP